MALDCEVNALLAASRKFLEPQASQQERESIEIYFKVQNLLASGGANLTDINDLMEAAKAYRPLTPIEMQAMQTFISQDNAITAGASINTDINAIMAAARCYECIPQRTRQQILMFLKCAVNAEGSPD
jgi:predicted lipoprotein